MFPRILRRAAGALAVLAAPATAFAGGFEMPENGTRALGRAGAYVAGVDEPSALYFNPGALSRVDGFAFTLNLNLSNVQLEFDRAPFVYQDNDREGDRFTRTINFEGARNSAGVFPAPMFFASHDFGLERWTFGIGAYGPSAYGHMEFPQMEVTPEGFEGDPCIDGEFRPCRTNPEITRDGGNAFMLVSQNVLLVYPSLSVAYELEEIGLSIGITPQLALLFIDFDVGVDGASSQPSDVDRASIEAEELYSPTVFEATGVGATGILGILWEPNDRFALGASYRMRYKMKATGEIDIDLPQLGGVDVGFPDSNGELGQVTDATLRLTFPDILRVGAQYTHRNAANKEIFDVELDFTYETWSLTDAFRVRVDGVLEDNAGALGREIPPLVLRRNFNNTFSLRLGGDISVLRNADTGNGPVFRLGTFYESNGQDEEWTNIDFASWERWGLTVGASYHIGPVSIDAAFMHMWSPDRTVDNGEYDLLMPIWVCEDPPTEEIAAECQGVSRSDVVHPVNNGRYSTSAQIYSLGITYGW